MGSDVSRKWPSSSNTHTFAICSGSRFFFFFFFYNHTFLFGTTPEASLHGVKCPALCVCVGVQHYKYGGRRENEHVKRMHCRSLSFPFLFSICLFFSSLGQSVCLSQFVCPHLLLHFCFVSCRPPHISVYPLPPHPAPSYHHHGTIVGQGITEPDYVWFWVKPNIRLISDIFCFCVCFFVIPFDLCL